MPREVDAGIMPTFTLDLTDLKMKVLGAPGKNAWMMTTGSDKTTYFVSTGVSNCAILTLYYPRTGLRAMAHYNSFGGPTAEDFRRHLDGMKKWLQVRELVASISCNTMFDSTGGNRPRLVRVLDAVLPEVQDVNIWKYTRHEARNNKVRIYLAPNGSLFGAAEG